MPARCGLRLLRLRDVEAMAGIKRSQIYRLIAQGRFPAQLALGPMATAWVLHEVQAWLVARCPASLRLLPTGVVRVLPEDSSPADGDDFAQSFGGGGHLRLTGDGRSADLSRGHVGIWRFTGDERIEEVGAVPFER